jgi:hypothetical protein
MPLKSGKSNVGSNISKLTKIGKPTGQAIAIALDVAGRQRKDRARGGSVVGALKGKGKGRADDIKISARPGSHVIPADVVSAMGGGNSIAGHDILGQMFPKSIKPRLQKGAMGQSKKVPNVSPTKIQSVNMFGGRSTGKMFSDGGSVPIAVSDGEFIISPEDVKDVGEGNIDAGHKVLNDFIIRVRASTVDQLKQMENPT